MLTDPDTVEGALTMIRDIGWALDAPGRAAELVESVEDALAEPRPARAVRTFAAVWHNPLMGLGSKTYGHSLLEACGAVNVLGERQRYPELAWDELRSLAPDLILLPDEPFPFDQGHAAVYAEVAPARLVDGKLLWWYGPRMPGAIRTLRALIANAAHGRLA